METSTRMNERDGGLAKHAASCQHEFDCEQSRIVGKEELFYPYFFHIKTIIVSENNNFF